MDGITLLIVGGIVVLIIIVVFIVLSKDKPAGQTEKEKHGQAEPKKETLASKRFKQVLSGADLPAPGSPEEQELLTKYTAGTGEGISEVEKLLESDPNNVDLLDWLAFMYYSNNEIDKAIGTYKRALVIKPDNENQHYYLANSYFKKGNYEEAKKCWKEVIRLKPNSKIAQNAQERIDFTMKK